MGRGETTHDTPGHNFMPRLDPRSSIARPPRLDAEAVEFAQCIFHLASSGDVERLATLLDRGIDPDLRDAHGHALLLLASEHGRCGVAQVLLEHGADVDGLSPDGQTALMLAAMHDREDMADVLLAHGAACDVRDAFGLTARDYAARFGAVNALERLLDA